MMINHEEPLELGLCRVPYGKSGKADTHRHSLPGTTRYTDNWGLAKLGEPLSLTSFPSPTGHLLLVGFIQLKV